MDIKQHFNLILEKYKINKLYKKYIFMSMFSTVVREGFYWALLYFSETVKTQPEMITKYSLMLLLIFSMSVPVDRYFLKVKADLVKQLRLANYHHFNNKILSLDKNILLNFDLVEYYNILDHFSDNILEYITNQKNKYDIPIRTITLIIIAMNKRFNMLIGLFIVFYGLVKWLNEDKMIVERDLTEKFFKYETTSRNYLINSKIFLMNGEFNKEYHTNNLINYEKTNEKIMELNNDLDMKVNILMLIFILIVIKAKVEKLTPSDFFYYFLIVYDVEFIADKVNEYYKNRVNYNKMQERLNYLNSFNEKVISKKYPVSKLDKITINKIVNTIPKLENFKPIVINKGDHILINGESGSGKTSLLYMFKGILKPETLDITPNINMIASNTYLTLANHKSLYDGNLYDIISNYNKKPNIELIKYAIGISKMNHRLDDNSLINIEKLSGGERIRVIIARLIYSIKTANYSVLLFDEIDENLNDDLALEVAKNLLEIFNDKIILYVTHNEKVKELFKKRINVVKGQISY
jgi:ABC-type lipoprotein export system ATPase subunit